MSQKDRCSPTDKQRVASGTDVSEQNVHATLLAGCVKRITADTVFGVRQGKAWGVNRDLFLNSLQQRTADHFGVDVASFAHTANGEDET